jgi:hypothetical protein
MPAFSAREGRIVPMPHLNAVLACSGLAIGPGPILHHAREFNEIGSFIRSLTTFADEVREELQDHESAIEGAAKLVILYLAFYDRERRTPGAIQVLPEGGRFSAPYTIRAVTTGGQPSAALAGRERMEGRQEVVAFMEAARTVPAITGNPGCAGWVDFARVSAKGISIRTVHRWPL